MTEPITTTQIVIHGGLALAGALTHASKAHRLGTSKTFIDFITLTLMSSFSGVMFALLAFHLFADRPYLTMAMAGVGGFLGVEGMAVIVSRLQEMLTKR